MNIQKVKDDFLFDMFNPQLPAWNLLITGEDGDLNRCILSNLLIKETRKTNSVIVCNLAKVSNYSQKFQSLSPNIKLINQDFKINPFEIIDIATFSSPSLEVLRNSLKTNAAGCYGILLLISDYLRFYDKEFCFIFKRRSNPRIDITAPMKRYNELEAKILEINPNLPKSIDVCDLIHLIYSSKETQTLPGAETIYIGMKFIKYMIEEDTLFDKNYEKLEQALLSTYFQNDKFQVNLKKLYNYFIKNNLEIFAYKMEPFLNGQFDTDINFDIRGQVTILGIDENIPEILKDFLSMVVLYKTSYILENFRGILKTITFDNLITSANSPLELIMVETIRRARPMGIATVFLSDQAVLSKDMTTDRSIISNFQHIMISKGKKVLNALSQVHTDFIQMEEIEDNLYVS